MSAIPPLKDLLDLGELSQSLKKKKCVLMLGPRIATIPGTNGQDIPLLEGLALEFARRLDAQKIPYDKSSVNNLRYLSQLYLREQNISKEDLRDISQKYIVEKSGGDDYIPAIYEELAKLPVRIIVNTTPDDFMLRALRKVGKEPVPFNFNYEVNAGSERNTQQPVGNVGLVSMMQPLLFNLFGNWQDPTSMVITEADQMAYVRNVLEGKSRIPQEILNLFKPDNTYLFFGFNLENWQFRLLLKSLQLDEKNRTFSPQTDNYPVSEITRYYLRHEFNFHFVDVRMADFAREISTLASGFDSENVFISYSDVEADRKEVEKLLQLLKPLRIANPRLKIWHRAMITSGDVEKQVAEAMEKANIIVPLLTANYFDDDRIFETDLPLLKRRYNAKEAEVAPVLLKPCLWDADPFFQRLERLPGDAEAKPITGADNEDEAFRSVAAAFKKRFL